MSEEQKSSAREEIIKKADYSYKDERGKIDNYTLPEPINWIGLITSRKGAIRANHFHPVQEQKVLLVSGSYISIYKDLTVPDGLLKHHLVKAGDIVITPPNMAHAQIFLENSALINLVKGERIPDNYGKHTKPHELLKPEEAEKYTSMYGQNRKNK